MENVALEMELIFRPTFLTSVVPHALRHVALLEALLWSRDFATIPAVFPRIMFHLRGRNYWEEIKMLY